MGKNKLERVFGLQVRCRELEIFKILEKCFENFWGNFFVRNFLVGFFVGGIFFGGILWEELLSRN